MTVEIVGYPIIRKTFGKKALAEQWAKEQETAMREGTWKDAKKARGLLLSEAIELYKAQVAPKLKNVLEQCRIADVLKEEFGHYTMANLEPRRITEYRDRMAKRGLGASTINHHINTLSAIYTALLKQLHIPIPLNPVKQVIRMTPPRPRRQRVSDEQLSLLIEANRETNETRRSLGGRTPTGEFEAWMRLALETAMRRSEIAGLLWKNVDLDGRIAKIFDTKNGDNRAVPLSLAAIRVLTDLKARRKPGQERVFVLTKEGFKSAYRRARDHAAKSHATIKSVRFHDARHEATSRMAKKLPNVVELGAVTGHRKLDQLAIYYNPDPTELAKKLD